MISNPTVCDVCAFKPIVFGETKLFAVLRQQQDHHSLHAAMCIYDFVMCLLCGKLSRTLIALQNIVSHVGVFPVLKKSHIGHVNHRNLNLSMFCQLFL